MGGVVFEGRVISVFGCGRIGFLDVCGYDSGGLCGYVWVLSCVIVELINGEDYEDVKVSRSYDCGVVRR